MTKSEAGQRRTIRNKEKSNPSRGCLKKEGSHRGTFFGEDEEVRSTKIIKSIKNIKFNTNSHDVF